MQSGYSATFDSRDGFPVPDAHANFDALKLYLLALGEQLPDLMADIKSWQPATLFRRPGPDDCDFPPVPTLCSFACASSDPDCAPDELNLVAFVAEACPEELPSLAARMGLLLTLAAAATTRRLCPRHLTLVVGALHNPELADVGRVTRGRVTIDAAAAGRGVATLLEARWAHVQVSEPAAAAHCTLRG